MDHGSVLLLCVFLIVAVLFVYRTKIKTDELQKGCLLALRLICSGGVMLFGLVAVLVLVEEPGQNPSNIWLIPLTISMVSIFLGFVIWFIYPCSEK